MLDMENRSTPCPWQPMVPVRMLIAGAAILLIILHEGRAAEGKSIEFQRHVDIRTYKRVCASNRDT